MPTDASRTPLALAILSMLKQPRHPYELRRLIRERGIDKLIKMQGGSLYDAVERLARLGLIEPVETGRVGARPERTVYALTEPGRRELAALLRELVEHPAKEFPRFPAALAHLANLPPEEAAALLTRRAARLEAEAAAAASERRDAEARGVPRIFLIELEFLEEMHRAELAWVRRRAREIEEGSLCWSLAQPALRPERAKRKK